MARDYEADAEALVEYLGGTPLHDITRAAGNVLVPQIQAALADLPADLVEPALALALKHMIDRGRADADRVAKLLQLLDLGEAWMFAEGVLIGPSAEA